MKVSFAKNGGHFLEIFVWEIMKTKGDPRNKMSHLFTFILGKTEIYVALALPSDTDGGRFYLGRT